MSFATSQPIVNRFIGSGDIATAIRVHLLANTGNQKPEKLPVVSRAVAATSTTIRMHPTRLAKIMRRIQLLVLDLKN